MAAASLPTGRPPRFGPSMVKNISWLACPPPLFRTTVRMSSGTRLKSAISSTTESEESSGMLLQGRIQLVDVGLVVFRVVNLHGPGVDVRFQRVIGIR